MFKNAKKQKNRKTRKICKKQPKKDEITTLKDEISTKKDENHTTFNRICTTFDRFRRR